MERERCELQAELWFDDALTTARTIGYPVLERHGLKAHISVITSRVGKESPIEGINYPVLTVEDLKFLIGKGWEIASHSVTHPMRFDLLTPEETAYELEESKRWIRENLNVTPTKFVIPNHAIRNDQLGLVRKHYLYIRPPGNPIEGHLIFHWIVSEEWLENLLARNQL